MIRTIIFDIGMVLMDFCFETCFRKHAEEEEIFQRLLKATVQSPLWDEFDRGVLSDEEILRGFIQSDPGVETQLREVFDDLENIVEKRDYAVPWIEELKGKGYRVLVLSNFPERTYRACREKMDFLDVVDGGILSFQVKEVKPHETIYRLLLEQYELKAEECVFLDDRAENIETAKRLGMQGILFTSREEAEKELRFLGV